MNCDFPPCLAYRPTLDLHNKEKQVENGKDTDDFEIEITDIPQDEGGSVSMAFLKLGSHFSPKSRTWRYSLVAGTLFLVLLVLVSSFPSLLDTTWELFRKSPASGSSLTSRQLYVAANLLPAPLGPAPRSCPSIAHLHDFGLPTFPPGSAVPQCGLLVLVRLAHGSYNSIQRSISRDRKDGPIV